MHIIVHDLLLHDKHIKSYTPKPESPSYPCEYSVAAGVAVTIFSHFYPAMADSVNTHGATTNGIQDCAGIAFPSDTRAGFELGKKIAEKEIEHTKDYVVNNCMGWKDARATRSHGEDKFPMFPLAGKNKTVVLESGSQFRPGPPPDFAKDMAEMKNYKQTFSFHVKCFFLGKPIIFGVMC